MSKLIDTLMETHDKNFSQMARVSLSNAPENFAPVTKKNFLVSIPANIIVGSGIIGALCFERVFNLVFDKSLIYQECEECSGIICLSTGLSYYRESEERTVKSSHSVVDRVRDVSYWHGECYPGEVS